MRKSRRGKAASLRYYLYISDAKLDMLFEQIDESILKHISAEVKVNLKIASVTLRKAEDPAPARMSKLRIVERFIDEHHNVGTIENPGREYFRGRMDMQSGWLIRDSEPYDPIPVVFFRGGEERSRLILLAGSRRNVIGEGPDAEAHSYSGLPGLTSAIKECVDDSIPEAGPDSVSDTSQRQIEPYSLATQAAGIELYPENTPAQRVEFLAIHLAQSNGSGAGGLIVLGTPLYVALSRE